MAEGSEALIRWENDALSAMMEIRWALDRQEDPKERHIRILRTSVEHLIEEAGKVRAQQVKDEEEYQRREYGDE